MRREPAWVAPFLRALERHGNVSGASKGAGVRRRTVYYRRDRNAKFRSLWDSAIESFERKVERKSKSFTTFHTRHF